MKIKTKFLKIISDIHTPVGVYLKLRDLYSKVFLLGCNTANHPASNFFFDSFAEQMSEVLPHSEVTGANGYTVPDIKVNSKTHECFRHEAD